VQWARSGGPASVPSVWGARLSVAIIENDASANRALGRFLLGAGFEPTGFDSAETFLGDQRRSGSLSTRSRARRCIDSSTARPSTSRSRPLLRFAELQDELVGVSANRCIEHFGGTGVRRVGQNRTLGVELESRSFNFSAHG